MRWINRAVTAAIAVAVVIGPPLAAIAWLRSQPDGLPTAPQILNWIEQPSSIATPAVLVGGIASIIWLLLVAAIGYRAWYVLTTTMRRLRRAPMPTAAQVTAGSMAGIAAIAMPSFVVPPLGEVAAVSAPSDLRLAAPEASSTPAGFELPGGGWVPYRTAAAVSVLGAAIWLYRRQHYHPGGPRTGVHRDDDLQPLPGTADAIIAGLDDAPPADIGADPLLPRLPAGLIQLYGPGAAHAARGLLITTILQAALGADTAAGTITMRSSVFEQLLGIRTPAEVPSGLHLDDAAAPAVSGLLGTDVHYLTRPVLVIRLSPHDSAGSPDELATVIVLGEHDAPGRRWHVAADGRTTGADTGAGLRLCLLDAQAAADLLTLAARRSTALPRLEESVVQAAPAPGMLRLLGGCRLLADGTALRVRRSAGLQVLAYLAVHPDGAATTEILRALWPGEDPHRIIKRLHTTLTALREQLHPRLDDAIVRHDERYRLNPDVLQCDLDQLHRAITAAATAITGPQRTAAARALTDAYPGELGAGFSWPWLQPVREALRRDVIEAHLRLAAAAPAAEAVELVRAAIAVDPVNEGLVDQAATLLEAIGDPDAAHALRRSLGQRRPTGGFLPPAPGHR